MSLLFDSECGFCLGVENASRSTSPATEGRDLPGLHASILGSQLPEACSCVGEQASGAVRNVARRATQSYLTQILFLRQSLSVEHGSFHGGLNSAFGSRSLSRRRTLRGGFEICSR
ncbi:hypothetical protein Q31a_30670 [Aureliella helgolandensis]|uniref:Uncharacterized protein n=1 Tax=Aureliella helgolandensis TaxID=2527968 RepID=A0A518G827_9BACT|nr:hypothetical protein Q31a_30670 [Aureliella helgolandensis]